MSLNIQGINAEKLARQYLQSKNVYNMQQLDWFIKIENKYYIVEVKDKQLYDPPPIKGTGLDIRQLKFRKQVYDDLGIDTILMVFEKNTNNVYTQCLSVLEATKDYHDTKNNIRIYNIKHFKKEVFAQHLFE